MIKSDYPGTHFALLDYYVKSSFNSCCTGPVINGHVSFKSIEFRN